MKLCHIFKHPEKMIVFTRFIVSLLFFNIQKVSRSLIFCVKEPRFKPLLAFYLKAVAFYSWQITEYRPTHIFMRWM